MIGERKGVPVRLNWAAKDREELDLVGLMPSPQTKKEALVRRCMSAGILLESIGLGRPIFYSRDRSHYAAVGKRYSRGLYTYANVVGCVDALDACGLIDHRRASPGVVSSYRSEFDPHPEFLEYLAAVAPDLLSLMPHEVIEYREVQTVGTRTIKIPVDYRDTESTRRERRRLHAFNEALAAANLRIDLPGGEWFGPLYREVVLKEDGTRAHYHINTSFRPLIRKWRYSRQRLGGRFYGGWWQNTRSEYRSRIRIDGEPTREPDYPELHPSMLYALGGRQMDGPAYDIGLLPDGVTRKNVKVAVNIMLNAETRESAVKAIAQHLKRPGAYPLARLMAARVDERHASIAKHFCSGAWGRLQYLDSQMAERVMQDALRRGGIVLPLHDGFRCKARDEGRVLEAMARAKHDVLRAAA